MIISSCSEDDDVAGQTDETPDEPILIEPKIGAIRWDAWTGTENSVGVQVERSLSPKEYHFRVPFFGDIVGENEVKIDGTTQAIVDKEIEYAVEAGLDYWAFLWYPSPSGLDEARKLYYESSKKSLIDYCLIIESSRFNNQISIDEVVEEFADDSYVKVLEDRPLLYFFGAWALTPEEIEELRTKAAEKGLGDPYIVLLLQSNEIDRDVELNLDAVSRYVVGWIKDGAPYSDITEEEVKQWNWVAKTRNKKFVPHVTTSWDKRPRYYNPVSWEQPPQEAPDRYAQMPTPDELSDHFQDAIDWVKENPAWAEANTILIYAWNEHDEGGWLCPTLNEDGSINTERIEALKAVLK